MDESRQTFELTQRWTFRYDADGQPAAKRIESAIRQAQFEAAKRVVSQDVDLRLAHDLSVLRDIKENKISVAAARLGVQTTVGKLVMDAITLVLAALFLVALLRHPQVLYALAFLFCFGGWLARAVSDGSS